MSGGVSAALGGNLLSEFTKNPCCKQMITLAPSRVKEVAAINAARRGRLVHTPILNVKTDQCPVRLTPLVVRSPQRTAGRGAGVLAAIDDHLTVDDHILDSFRVLKRLGVGRVVDHAVGVEDHDVGKLP